MVFQQKIPFELIAYPYRIRTIDSAADLLQVLELRKRCFQADIDKLPFDLKADHLVVEDMNRNILCGTYRVSHSAFCDSFECEEDFHIESFLQTKDSKMELAWACIDDRYRSGTVLSLLWRGISEIIKITETRYIFGITSIKEDLEEVAQIREALRKYEIPMNISAREEKLSKNLETYELKNKTPKKSLRKLIPGLLRAYLMAGAFIYSQPTFDPDLNCYDFMTVMEVDQLTEPFNHHYKLHSSHNLENEV